MAVSKDIRKYIEDGDFRALEEAWLTGLADAPEDIDFFVGMARALKGAGQAQRASAWLELVDEELAAGDRGALRLVLARKAGDLLRPPAELHRSILEILRRLHASSPSREGLIEHVGLHRAIEDLPRTWEKVDRLQALLAYDLGAVVWMKGNGAGRVSEVNLELASFKVDFERQEGLRVGFSAAPKLLEPLPPGHLLRRKFEAPEELTEMKRLRPEALLLAVLAGHREGLTVAEIRDALAGIVTAGEWSAWWAAARCSRRVLAEGTGARQRYRATASDDEAGASIERAFRDADLAGKLELYRRHGGHDPARGAAMAAELERLAGAADVELAFTVAAAVSDVSQRSPSGAWTPAERLDASPDPAALVAGLSDRGLRERCYRWLHTHRPDDAEWIARGLRLEVEVRLCDLLAGWLAELAPERVLEFADEVSRQPRRLATGFVWLLEQAAARPELLRRSPLRALQHLFAAFRQEEFKVHRARLRKLCEGGPLLPLLLGAMEAGQAEAATQAIERAPLEEYLRAPLLEALALRFPALRAPRAAALYALPSSISARREELRQLKEREIPTNRRAIEEARELGDLRENFEYKSARQRHEYLTARAAGLERDLALARPIDLARDDCTEVRIAVRVRVADDGREQAIAILGPWESDPERGRVSYDSDLGRALLGKKPGEEAEFGGRRLTVLTIEPLGPESVT